MTSEEQLAIQAKAKAYYDALERAKGVIEQNPLMEYLKKGIEYIFPELKESEDEVMKKKLLELVAKHCGKTCEMYLWLEKQGKQKSIDNLTQQEAMDIAVAKCFEQEERKPIFDIEIPFGAKDSELQGASYHIPEGFHAEIDDDKVVIKKGEKPAAWNEEDEKMIHHIENAIKYDKSRTYLNSKDIAIIDVCNWLKSIKERYTWKPSIAQLNALSIVSKGNAPDDIEAIVSLYEQLKKLKKE